MLIKVAGSLQSAVHQDHYHEGVAAVVEVRSCSSSCCTLPLASLEGSIPLEVLDCEDRLIACRGKVDLQMAQAVCSAGHLRLGVLVNPVQHSEMDSLEWDDRS